MIISQAKLKDRESEMYNQYWPVSDLLPSPSHYVCEAHHPDQPCLTVMPQRNVHSPDVAKANHLCPATAHACSWHTCGQAEYTVQLYGE